MNRINRLLAEHCPAGVEHQELGQVGIFIRGNGLQKGDLAASGIGAIHYGQIHTHYGTWARETKSFVSPALGNKLRKAKPGDLVIATTSEDDEAVAKAVAWLGEAEVAVSGDAYIFRHSLDPRYASYLFQSEDFQSQKKPRVTGTKVRRISGNSLAMIRVPVPPIIVQREISEILDRLSSLGADLETRLQEEVEARRAQYHHYRDTLLAFDGHDSKQQATSNKQQATSNKQQATSNKQQATSNKQQATRIAALSDIGNFIRGRRFTKADYASEGIDCIHYGEIYTRYGVWADRVVSHVRSDMAAVLRFAEPGDVVITDVGETVEDVGKAVAWIGTDKVAIHDHCYAFRHAMNPKFVAYCMQTTWFIAQKAKYVARTKVNTLLMDGFAKICIPVPPLEEQARIVGILDEFDALVNDLSSGLPAEIQARRQQYQHYRDRLLTFKMAA